MIELLKKTLIEITETIPYDFFVGKEEDPYMLRWFLYKSEKGKPRGYIHKFLRSDYDEALHDHTSPSVSLLFEGEYIEHTRDGERLWQAPAVIFRDAETPHRIELIDNKPAYTLFFFGDNIRDWGFHCPKGWIHNKQFVQEFENGNTGKGCPE
jgi:hypothetical protein